MLRNNITKKQLIKFLSVLIILLAYTLFVILKYGAKDGVAISVLTWSFFVFCTPIADAGFLIDFPIRLLTGMRMIYSEMIVWALALITTLGFLLVKPSIYQNTIILNLFHHILTTPVPYWLIIILSAAGTFLSIHIGDELYDSIKSKRLKYANKYYMIVAVFIILFIIVLYDFMLKKLGLHITF